MISEVRFHCGYYAQRPVNPAEIVVGEVNAVRNPSGLAGLLRRYLHNLRTTQTSVAAVNAKITASAIAGPVRP